ncbi:MAG: hydroxyacid dehydrogenase, partial [Acetobacteraceae bacterium]|nr:hydroxyacid dehydrogenase [Acetobacteraceae bacterium]
MPSNRKVVMVPRTMGEAGQAVLSRRDDIELRQYSTALKQAELLEALGDVAGIALSVTPFGKAEMDAAPAMQVVARIGVGYDAVDVPALTARRVPLMIAGTSNSTSVAEHALYLIMTLAKRGPAMNKVVREGRWTEGRRESLPAELAGKAVLVVGFGRIGTRLAKRCAAMDMRVLVYDPYVPAEAIRAAGHEPVADLDAALPEADFVTIHCPKTPETVGLFDAARLAQMKRTAFIVNTARGGIIDEKALFDSLKASRIAGAALDVFDQEPTPQDNPLLTLPNFIAAPHVAGVTREAVDRMGIA